MKLRGGKGSWQKAEKGGGPGSRKTSFEDLPRPGGGGSGVSEG